MKTVFSARVLLPFRYKNPRRYDPVKGHTGVDLQYDYEPYYSHVTGLVVAIRVQPEMGLCAYIRDAWGAIHLLAHFSRLDKAVGEQIVRGKVLGITGGARGGRKDIPGDRKNAGSQSDGPHVHWEVIVPRRPHRTSDKVMTRDVGGFSGWNTDPLLYTADLYNSFGVPVK